MIEKTRWKSALKASFLLYLGSTVVVTFLAGFFPETVSVSLKNLNPPSLVFQLLSSLFLFFVCSILMVAETVVWALFGKFYNKIPTSRTITKVFIFNFVLSAITHGMRELMKTNFALSVLPEPLYFASKILDVILWPIFFTILFNYFEKNTRAVELNKRIVSASIGRRVIAFIIDFVIVAVLSNSILMLAVIINGAWYFASPQNPFKPNELFVTLAAFSTIFGILLALAYWTSLEGKYGKTLGKRLMGITVVKIDGSKPTCWDALFRNFTKALPYASIFFYAETVLLVFGKDRQRFSDKIANTYVVRVKSG